MTVVGQAAGAAGLHPRNTAPATGKRKTFVIRVLLGALVIGLLVWGWRSYGNSRHAVSSGPFSLLLNVESGPRVRVDVVDGRMRVVLAESHATPEVGPRLGVAFDMQMNHEDLGRLVDALGGIVINIPETIEYKGPDGLPIRIDMGMRRLDADRVSRYLERPGAPAAASLRAIILGVTSQVAALDADHVDIERLLAVALPAEAQGDDGGHAARLAGLLRAARGFGPTDIQIDWSDRGGSASAAAPTAATTPPAPEAMTSLVRLRILNGTRRVGLAARVAARFPARRFEIIETRNADRFGYRESEVRGGDETTIREVIGLLGRGRYQPGLPRPQADVEIILGEDASGL